MKAIKIDIRNVLGIRELSIDLGKITVVSGPNAVCKTAILRAMQNVMEGGSLKEIRNIHASDDEKTEVGLVFEDDELGQVLVKKTASGLTIKKQVGDSAGFEPVPKPAEFLKDLYDAKSANPVKFLNCRDRDRVTLILEALDLEYDADDLWSKIGLDRNDFDAVPAGLHPLLEIGLHRKNIFSKRTGVNTTADAKRKTCQENRLTIPAEIPTVEGIEDKEAALVALRQTVTESKERAEAAYKEKIEKIESGRREFESECRKELAEYEAELKSELDTKLYLKREETQMASSKLSEVEKISLQSAMETREEILNHIQSDMDRIEKTASELAELRERQKHAIQIQTISNQADKFEIEANELEIESKRLTEALKSLDKYKAGMCSSLPIPGLDVTGNVVTIDGVKWNQINTEKQVRTAVQVSCLRAKKMKYKAVWVDGAECLDKKNFEALCDELDMEGMQAIVGVVDHSKDAKFKIEKIGE